MTPSDILVPTFTQMLEALSKWLTKAEEQRPGGAADALLAARLATDMLPLATQVRYACWKAQEGVFRLLDVQLPPSLNILFDEGRNAGAKPGTLVDAQLRIAETLTVVRTATGPSIEPTAMIAHTLPNGMTLDLTAEQYTRDWALPQFYFHIVTAYSIIRAQGVILGKADYIAHIFTYLRSSS